jgi:RecA-family ATPase
MGLKIDETLDQFEQSRFAGWSTEPWNFQVTAPEWFMDRLIPEYSIGMLYGPSNSGKSHLACDLALAVVRGDKTWCDQPIQEGSVVIFSESIGHTRARLKAYSEKVPCDMKHNLHVLPPSQLERNEIDLFLVWLMNLPEPPVMLIFDTFSTSFSFTGGESENDNSAVAKLIANLMDVVHLMARKSTLMFVHHTSKASGGHSARGASALIGNIDYSIRVEWDEDTEKTMAFWEKDRWRLAKESPVFAGTMRKVDVDFTNGQEMMAILDWEYQSMAEIEAEKQEAEEMEFSSIKVNFKNRVNEFIRQHGFAFFKTNPNAKVKTELLDGWVQPNDFCPKHYQKALKEWVLDSYSEHRRETVNGRTGAEVGIRFS